MLQVIGIPAFTDNYLWLIHNGKLAVAVDPGDYAPIANYLEQNHLSLHAILLTHHHADHTGGVEELVSHGSAASSSIPVYGPLHSRIPHITHPLQDNQEFSLDDIGLSLRVMAVPGHTLDHIAYLHENWLFCGDTLFAGGCGRVFEGTMAQMHASLSRLRGLPADTLVYCAHEYTLSNLRFALAVEPNNTALQDRMRWCETARSQHKATVPSRLDWELATNPFLRWDSTEVIRSAEQHINSNMPLDGVGVFSTIREWKNNFR